MSGPVDDYLVELERRLPRVGRARLLAEAEDHLREAAAEAGEAEAVARFGSPGEFVRLLRPLRAAAWNRLAALAAVAAVLALPLAYPLYETNLPPAPWPSAAEIPAHLAWKRDALAVLALVTLGAAVGSFLGSRVARTAVALAPAALGATGVLLILDWADAVPGTPGWLLAVAFGQLGLCLVPSALAARAALLATGAS
jgi:hypothetical protein